MSRFVRSVAAAVALSFVALSSCNEPPTTPIVISQVYGGGGNSGATLTNDFIELFNPGALGHIQRSGC